MAREIVDGGLVARAEVRGQRPEARDQAQAVTYSEMAQMERWRGGEMGRWNATLDTKTSLDIVTRYDTHP